MKTTLALIAAIICLSFTNPDVPVAKKASSSVTSTAKASVNRRLDFPRGISWNINYFQGLPMVTLNWPAFTQPGLGGVPFTFMGVTQMINPTSITSIYWAGVAYTLTPNTSYTMNIAGVNYYFYWPGNNISQCVITGHD